MVVAATKWQDKGNTVGGGLLKSSWGKYSPAVMLLLKEDGGAGGYDGRKVLRGRRKTDGGKSIQSK